MHTNVPCSSVYNSKDLEPTQMPIDDRLDRENAAPCSNQKRWGNVLCRDMDESGEHHSQQTDTRIENEIPHILTHRWVMNNENTWTQGGEHYTLGSIVGNRGGTAKRGAGEGWHGEKCQMWVKRGRQQITVPRVYLCNHLACSAHVPQNLKWNN